MAKKKHNLTSARIAVLRALQKHDRAMGKTATAEMLCPDVARSRGRRSVTRQYTDQVLRWLWHRRYVAHDAGRHGDWRLTAKGRRALREDADQQRRLEASLGGAA